MRLGFGRREECGQRFGLSMGGSLGGGLKECTGRWTIKEMLPRFLWAAVMRMLDFCVTLPVGRRNSSEGMSVVQSYESLPAHRFHLYNPASVNYIWSKGSSDCWGGDTYENNPPTLSGRPTAYPHPRRQWVSHSSRRQNHLEDHLIFARVFPFR